MENQTKVLQSAKRYTRPKGACKRALDDARVSQDLEEIAGRDAIGVASLASDMPVTIYQEKPLVFKIFILIYSIYE